MRAYRIAIGLVGLLVLSGCQDDSGSRSAGRAPAPAQAPHWDVAMAAMAAAPTPEPLTLDAVALDRWNERVERAWPGFRDDLVQRVTDRLPGLVGRGSSDATIVAATLSAHHLDGAPAFAAGGNGPGGQWLELLFPADPAGWSLELRLTVEFELFGGSATLRQQADVLVRVDGIRASQELRLDVSDPVRPEATLAGPLQLAPMVTLDSSHPLASGLFQLAAPLIDQLVQDEVHRLIDESTLQLTRLFDPPGPGLGVGGPAPPALTGAPVDLAALAAEVDSRLRAENLHYGLVTDAFLDDPVWGQGQVTGLHGFGDSAFWTGHYLAALAYRYSVDPAPEIIPVAEEMLEGLTRCLDVSLPAAGLLSRTAVPTSWPMAAGIPLDDRSFTATLAGQSYYGIDKVSRDQYVGVMLGLSVVARRVPPLAGRAAQLVDRILGYLEATEWNALRMDGRTVSASFATAPLAIMSFLQVGRSLNPGRWESSFQHFQPVLQVGWITSWLNTRNMHEEYYKFNLGQAMLINLVEYETDPDRYRQYLKILRMLRAALHHHGNPWFDAVYGSAVPTEAPAIGPQVQDGLQRFATRSRRGFVVANSQDPTIATTLFHFLDPQKAPEVIAAHPLPIERRPASDYLWQRSPFQLDGGWQESYQPPGIDLLLPYWFARAHGLIDAR